METGRKRRMTKDMLNIPNPMKKQQSFQALYHHESNELHVIDLKTRIRKERLMILEDIDMQSKVFPFQ